MPPFLVEYERSNFILPSLTRCTRGWPKGYNIMPNFRFTCIPRLYFCSISSFCFFYIILKVLNIFLSVFLHNTTRGRLVTCLLISSEASDGRLSLPVKKPTWQLGCPILPPFRSATRWASCVASMMRGSPTAMQQFSSSSLNISGTSKLYAKPPKAVFQGCMLGSGQQAAFRFCWCSFGCLYWWYWYWNACFGPVPLVVQGDTEAVTSNRNA